MPREYPEPSSPQLRQIDSTSSTPFLVQGGRMLLMCMVYPDAGTAWNLQMKSPIDASDDTEVWVNTGISIDSVGQEVQFLSPRFKYRFNGGTTGTEIWVTPAGMSGGNN